MRAALLMAMLLVVPAACAQWEIQDAHVTADLRGIDYVGGGVAWASGSHGTVLRTEDMGFVWQLCATPPDAKDLDFRGVQAFDNNTAIVMASGLGDKSRLYKTTDGCQTWTLVFTNPDKDGFWDSLHFQNRGSGVLLGDPVHGAFFLARTDDGGRTWIQQRNAGLKADPKLQGAFAASNSSLTVIAGGAEFASGGLGGAKVYDEREITICLDACPEEELNQDGAKNKWIRADVAVGSKSEASGIFSLGFRPAPPPSRAAEAVVAVGGDYLKPDAAMNTAAYLKQGSWRSADTSPHGYRSSVAYYDNAKAWITVGPNGTDVSTDDGRNWRALRPRPGDAPDADKHWNALSLPFVVGPKGRIGILRDAALRDASGKDLDAAGAKNAK